MTYQVIDPTGHWLTLEDDQPVPNGCRLAIEMKFMDSVQRAVHDGTDDIIDGLTLTDTELAEARRAEAYATFKASQDTAYGKYTANSGSPPTARRQPLPQPPSWQRAPWKKPQGWEIGPAAPADSAPPPVVHDERREAYEARNVYYRDAYLQNKGVASSPAVGPSQTDAASRSRLDNLRRIYGDQRAAVNDQRETAYMERTAWLNNAWRENRGVG